MDMFTVKQTGSNWLACCRACGHEQVLPRLTEGGSVDGMSVKCERCPSEENQLSLPNTSPAAIPAGSLGQSPVSG